MIIIITLSINYVWIFLPPVCILDSAFCTQPAFYFAVLILPLVGSLQSAFYSDRYFRAVFTWLSKGIGFGFGFGFTTPFGWLVYLLSFWFYDSQVKTALIVNSIPFSLSFTVSEICLLHEVASSELYCFPDNSSFKTSWIIALTVAGRNL